MSVSNFWSSLSLTSCSSPRPKPFFPVLLIPPPFHLCWVSLQASCGEAGRDLKAPLVPFHLRKFAPRCSVCGGAIMPEPGQEETVRIVALDRSFHIGCYKCEVRGPWTRARALQSLGCWGRTLREKTQSSQANWQALFLPQECGLLLSSEGECQGCYPLDGHILCKACSAWRIQELSATITTDC